MMNMLKSLKDKVDSVQAQMANVSREMKSLRKKKQKEMLTIKNTVTELRNAFEGLISRPETAEGRISELEDVSIESSKT